MHPHFHCHWYSFLYWCVMRPASQRFFIHSCIYQRILIISYLATFLGTIVAFLCCMCREAVNQSTMPVVEPAWDNIVEGRWTLRFIHFPNFRMETGVPRKRIERGLQYSDNTRESIFELPTCPGIDMVIWEQFWLQCANNTRKKFGRPWANARWIA